MKRLLALLFVLLSIASCLSVTPDALCEPLDEATLLSYYDDSIFFGDSVMQAFRRYRSAKRETEPDFLEGIQIVCTASISLYEGSLKTMQTHRFQLRGVDRSMYQIVQLLGPKKVYVLLGLNDPVGDKIEKAMRWAGNIIKNMRELAPDTGVCFFSLTPVTPAYCSTRNRPNYQTKIDKYNLRLQELCEELGAEFIDISTALKDEKGYLSRELSSDNICHLNDDGVLVWLKAMCDYAQARYDSGLWTPQRESIPASDTP